MVEFVNPKSLGELEENVVAINRVTKVVKGGLSLVISKATLVLELVRHKKFLKLSVRQSRMLSVR